MANEDLFDIKGFDELNKKLKTLPDKVKRSEVLKIQKRLSKPIITAYSNALPKGKKDKKRAGSIYAKGTLSKSVKAVTVPKSKSGGNPSIAIRPAKKGKNIDPWYRFMVVKKGTKTGSVDRGSRTGKNTVVDEARDKAAKLTVPTAVKKAEEDTAKYIQKQIDKLSK